MTRIDITQLSTDVLESQFVQERAGGSLLATLIIGSCLLWCVAVCRSVSQCVAVCCSVLQCVAVCCSVLQVRKQGAAVLWLLSQFESRLPTFCRRGHDMMKRDLCRDLGDHRSKVAVCCSVLLYVAVQCVAE